MLIKLGDIVGQASGSLRSNTYSHNRYGAYIRNRTIPVNPNTARQSTVRTLLQVLTNLWGGTLTDDQRAQWASYGDEVEVINRLGDTVKLTGLNHYVRSNLPRLLAGLTRIDTGPAEHSLPLTDESAAATYTADDQKVAVVFDDTMDWCDLDDAAMLVYSGIPVNSSINFFNGPFRFTDSIDGDGVAPPATPIELDSPFVFQTSQQVFSRYRITLDDGRLSNFFRLGSSVVTAS